jgi:long-subunit acyl-CoA synthetase (AMP-forming)
MLSGTVGKPLPGVEVRIAEPDINGVGEVLARGPNIMLGYYEDEVATRKTLVERWLYTGDLGRVDDDGNLYLVGRLEGDHRRYHWKERLSRRTRRALRNSPYVKELSIVGLADGIGEKVACLVVADDEYDISLSRARCIVSSKSTSAKSRLPCPTTNASRSCTSRHRAAAHGDAQSEAARSGQILESLEETQKSARKRAQRPRMPIRCG